MADDFNLLDTGLTVTAPALEASADAIEASTASIDSKLDVNLSTRASEATLATRASEATVVSIDTTLSTQLDVFLSTRASEATLGTVATNTGNTTTQVTTLNTNFGAQADSAASTDTGTFSLMALVKRLLAHLSDIKANERNSADTVMASAAHTTTNNSGSQTNLSAQGAHIIWDISATGGAVLLTPSVQALDVASGKWYDVLVGSLQVTTGTIVLKIHPGLPGVANKTAADGLPVTWRFVVTHGNATSATYSVGVNYLE